MLGLQVCGPGLGLGACGLGLGLGLGGCGLVNITACFTVKRSKVALTNMAKSANDNMMTIDFS